jgi:hypothetical protein
MGGAGFECSGRVMTLMLCGEDAGPLTVSDRVVLFSFFGATGVGGVFWGTTLGGK